MTSTTRLFSIAALFAWFPITVSAQSPPPGIPLLTTTPASATRTAGVSHTLSVTATGNTPMTYQWLRGTASSPTAEIAGATNASYFRASPTPADTAYYSVRVSNSLGSITSEPVLITYQVTAGSLASSVLPTLQDSAYAVLPFSDGSFLFGADSGIITPAGLPWTMHSGLVKIQADGSIDSTFVQIVEESGGENVTALTRDAAGRILVGGNFTSVTTGGPAPTQVARSGLARILANGTLDSAFGSPLAAAGTIHTIVEESGGTILVGGSMTNVTGLSGWQFLIRIDGTTGQVVPGFTPALPANQVVYALHVLADGKIMVGHNSGLALLNPNGTTAAGFTYGGSTAAVRAILPLPGGDFLIGRNGTSSPLLRINSSGALVSPFPATGVGPNNSVTELLALPSGNILAAGLFTTYGGTTVNRIVQIAPDGTVVAGINFGTGFNSTVNALAYDSQNNIWVAGQFSTYNGSTRRALTCLSSQSITPVDPGAPTPDAFTQDLINAGIPAARRGTADDPDGDGSSNLEEFNNGTDPANATSALFRLTTAGVGAAVSATPASASGLYLPNTPVELAVTPNPGLSFIGWGPSTGAANSTQPLGVVMNQNRSLTAYAGLPLADSLDAPSLTWTTGGAVLWTGTSATSQDGVDAAIVSGLTQTGQESWLETTVTGPGVLTFRWKLTTATTDSSILQIQKNGNPLQQLAATSGTFMPFTVNVTDSGPLTLRFRLSANVNGGVNPADTAVIDKYYFGPLIAPVLLPPTNLTATSATLNWAEVPGASGYDIVVATNPAFTGTQQYYWADRDVLSKTVSPLVVGTTYYYRITAYGPSGTTATKSTGSFTPADRQPQTIDFPQPAGKNFGDPAFALVATATSGLPVAFEVVSGPATLSGSTLTLTGGGSVIIRASQAGNANFFAATPVERTITVAPASQTLTFAQPSALAADPLAFYALAASASSGLPVVFTVESGPATVVDGMLQLTGTGLVRITASQPGNASYLAATPIAREFTAISAPTTAPMKVAGAGKLPGGSSSAAKAISADGRVIVGRATNASSANEAFFGSPATGLTGIGDLPGSSSDSQANGVSQDGAVIVGNGVSASGLEAFRWTSAGMIGLGDLPGGSASSQAFAVSLDGSVVVGMGQNGSFLNEAFRWTQAGGMVGLGILAGGNYSQALGVSGDGSTVVGVSSATGVTEMAFRWTQAGGMVALGDLAGGETRSKATAISADGAVIIGQSTSANGREAFRWTAAGGMVGLGDLPGGSFESEALAVSTDGSVIVGRATTASGIQAFIWDSTRGMRNLREVLTAANLAPGRVFHAATGISADGRFVTGEGNNRNGANEAWLLDLNAPVIPATEILMWTEDLPQTEPFKANSVVRMAYDNGSGRADVATQTGGVNGGFNGIEYADGKILVPNQATTLGTRVHDPRFSPMLVTNAFGYDLDAAPGVLWQTNGNAMQIIRNQVSATATESGGVFDYTFTPQQTTGIGKFTFPIQVVGSKVYFASPTSNPPGIFTMNTDGSNVAPLYTANSPVIYDFEVFGSSIYFCNLANNTIQRINIDGTEVVTLVSNAEFPNGIEVTDTGIYWTELLNGRIRRANLNGSNVTELISDLNAPRGVIVLPISMAPPGDPMADYLAGAGVPADQRGPNDDPDRDGVVNLIEYALDLPPNTSSAAMLPTPVPSGGQLNLTYRRARAELTYVVEGSSSLTNGSWSTVGINQGTPAPDGTTTASVPLTASPKFLRIAVTDAP